MVQHTVTDCNRLQHTATHCKTRIPHIYTMCGTCARTHSNVCTDSLRALPTCMHTQTCGNNTLFSTGLQCIAVWCGVLQSVAECCMYRSPYQNAACVYMYTLDLHVRHASLTSNMHPGRYASLVCAHTNVHTQQTNRRIFLGSLLIVAIPYVLVDCV